MAGDPGPRPLGDGRSRPVVRALVAAVLGLVVAGCAEDPVERTPLQQVDWRNGPYADPCVTDEDPEYVDGQTTAADGGEGSTALAEVGYAELDGREGDEAVLTHSCLTGFTSLTVWTSSDDGPRLLGAVEPPSGVADVREWADDAGVLCVSFNVSDEGEPDTPTETRPVQVGPDGLTVLEESSCEVDGG